MKTEKRLKTKSALSYFGSDSEVASDLAGLLSHCNHVTIPFVGGASIIPHLSARAIVANDLNELAINFYKVLSGRHGPDMRESLIRRCSHTLSHPSEIESAELSLAPANCLEDRAWAYWAQCWIGRKGKGGTNSPATMPSIRRTASGGTNASRIRAAANDLEQWAKHFERCEWECRDFREQLRQCSDQLQCGIYCDPPWVGAGRNYMYSFNDQDHRDLANALNRFKRTTVVIRYGNDEFIRSLYSTWKIIERSSRTQTGNSIDEIWIVNQPDSLSAT